MYISIKKKYYSNITPFEEIQADYSICLDSKNKNIVDRCILGIFGQYNVSRKTKNKKLLNNSQKTNLVVLKDSDISEIIEKINRENTPLSKCLVGDMGEYKVQMLNNKKKMLTRVSI